MHSFSISHHDRFKLLEFCKLEIHEFDCFAAIARTVGHLSKSAEVMKLVNNLMKAPEMAVTMQEFSKEMTKVCLKHFQCWRKKPLLFPSSLPSFW